MKKFTLFETLLQGAGIVMSLLSLTGLCDTGGCTEAHKFTFFGQPFAIAGLLLFAVLMAHTLIVAYLAERVPRLAAVCSWILPLLLSGALGGEIILLLLQKNVIGTFCPLCLGVGAVIFALVAMRSVRSARQLTRSDLMNWKTWGKALILLAVFGLGSVLTVAGTMREAQGAQVNPYVGKLDSKLEVLVFTDWYCPGCVAAEPVLESVYPELTQKARILFAAKTIHAESLNFFPFEYYFSVSEKGKLLQIRKALWGVAAKTKSPTPSDILAALKPLGVSYHEPPFVETMTAMSLYQQLSQQYEVHGTPTIVVRNTKSGNKKVLFGHKAITRESILAAVKELQ